MIEEIFCISLKQTKERREHFKTNYPLNIPYKYLIVEKDKRGGVYGCFNSHIKIIKDVYKRGLNNVLIFEDDAYPSPSYSKKKLDDVYNFLKTNKDWEIFYLGYFLSGTNHKNNNTIHLFSETINKDIIKFNPLGTHAYILNRKGMKKILDTYHNFIGICHYDMYLAKFINLKSYCISPIIFDQNYNLGYNIQPLYYYEYLIRKSYPFLNFIKIHYNFSLLTYYRSLLIILLYLF